MHAAFGLRLNETVTANVTVPVRRFGTRNNGTLYVHAVLYYPAPKSAAGALYEARNAGWRPNAPPIAHVSRRRSRKRSLEATPTTPCFSRATRDLLSRRTRALGRVGSPRSLVRGRVDEDVRRRDGTGGEIRERRGRDGRACRVFGDERRVFKDDGDDDDADVKDATGKPKETAGDAPAPAFDVIRRLEASRVRPPEGHAL